MKKIIATFVFVSAMALGTSVFAAGTDVANCAHMDKGKCVSMCAKPAGDYSLAEDAAIFRSS